MGGHEGLASSPWLQRSHFGIVGGQVLDQDFQELLFIILFYCLSHSSWEAF